MDSVSQIVLGAAVGELVAGKKAGNKALLWGAIAGTIPDLDVIPGQFLDTVTRLEIHRGFSHSLLFAISGAPVLGWLVSKIHKKTNPDWKLWSKLFFWGIITHLILDSFTTWGTQVFYPFEYRVDWNTIFVIDPLYTIPFLLAVVTLAFFNRETVWRRRINYIGLGISSLYLFITIINKNVANSHFEAELERQNIEYLRYSSRPAPLNSILWTANIESKDGYYIGYYSLIQDNPEIRFKFFPKNHQLIEAVKDDERIKRLLKLTKGWYTVASTDSGLIINDLRFGLADGWVMDKGNFVFAYPVVIEKSSPTDVVVIHQRRNTFENADELLAALWLRILGRTT